MEIILIILLLFLLLPTVLLTIYLFYSALWQNYYFSKIKIFYLGNALQTMVYNLIWKKLTIVDVFHIQYRKMREANVQIAGNVNMGRVTFVIVNPDLLKNIFIKDFDHFVNRRQFCVSKSDLLVNKMLIFTRDQEWKELRSKLSPTFTTGKIKRLFPLFNESSKKLVKFVEERMQDCEEFDLTEAYSKFTMDTIASAVCGYDSQAFNQKEPSIFEEMGKKLQFNFTRKQLFKLIFLGQCPKLADKMGLTLFDSEMHKFFESAIKSSIKERQEKGEKRNDFIQLMLDAREGKLKNEESELDNFEKDAYIKTETTVADLLDDDGIVSNCVLFLLAGFETAQGLLLFCAYALALNKDVQDKLRKEVDEVLEESEGEFSYDSLHKMTYLDMVINETLRLFPPAPMTDRGCTKDYKVPGTDLVIKKGQAISVPIIAIHQDERYYPNPTEFDPERFSPQNKHKINPYTFLAFGHGPRGCIGMRFALTETKLAIAQIIHNFWIEPSKRTMIPMQFKNAGTLQPKYGMYLSLRRRQV